jgi:hypothetical protein
VIRAIDQMWEPLSFTCEALLHAFPLQPAVTFGDAHWPHTDAAANALRW